MTRKEVMDFCLLNYDCKIYSNKAKVSVLEFTREWPCNLLVSFFENREGIATSFKIISPIREMTLDKLERELAKYNILQRPKTKKVLMDS